MYLNGKLDADVLHFSIDRDLDPEFKECWAKQTLPTPKLLARCPRQLKRGQKFPPSRKDAPLPSDTALASLLPIADHIGHRLQYTHQGTPPSTPIRVLLHVLGLLPLKMFVCLLCTQYVSEPPPSRPTFKFCFLCKRNELARHSVFIVSVSLRHTTHMFRCSSSSALQCSCFSYYTRLNQHVTNICRLHEQRQAAACSRTGSHRAGTALPNRVGRAPQWVAHVDLLRGRVRCRCP